MNKLLKGNYRLKKSNVKNKKDNKVNFSKLFENKAAEKLGGSIAFVMKEDNFIWEGHDEAAKR